MIVVKRGKEPNSLLKFRKENPDADYETDIPTEVSKDIREQMWEEQRGLCAYCMKKIKNSSVMRIEHCRARHPQDEQEHDKKATLDFKWMLGVCYGNSLVRGVKSEDKTCDAHRGNTELTVNPFDEMSVRKIKIDHSIIPFRHRAVPGLSFHIVSLPGLRSRRLFRFRFQRLRCSLLWAIVDDPVNHPIIVLDHHFRILQRIVRRKKIREPFKAKAVCEPGAHLSILSEHHHIADAHAAAGEPSQIIRIEAHVQVSQQLLG